ncbi:MAG: hypothetical protein ABH837_03080 [bacterium]
MSELEPTPIENGSESEEDERRSSEINRAQRALEELRNPTANGEFRSSLHEIHTTLRDTDITPEDIGTTEEEIEEFRKRKDLDNAKKALNEIRKGGNSWPGRMCFDLRSAGATPEDIGTTEEEIEEFYRKNKEEEAIQSLERLRDGKYVGHELLLAYFDYTRRIQKYLKVPGNTPEDIGTTEEEVEKLKIVAYKRAAEFYLAKARTGEKPASVWEIPELLEEVGLKPEDIGTTEQELKDLEAKADE